jgi:hypothetical protein
MSIVGTSYADDNGSFLKQASIDANGLSYSELSLPPNLNSITWSERIFYIKR